MRSPLVRNNTWSVTGKKGRPQGTPETGRGRLGVMRKEGQHEDSEAKQSYGAGTFASTTLGEVLVVSAVWAEKQYREGSKVSMGSAHGPHTGLTVV